jgi:hypothetical protein
MKLKLVKSFRGMTGNWEQKFEQIAAAGYAAVEGQPPVSPDEALFNGCWRSIAWNS